MRRVVRARQVGRIEIGVVLSTSPHRARFRIAQLAGLAPPPLAASPAPPLRRHRQKAQDKRKINKSDLVLRALASCRNTLRRTAAPPRRIRSTITPIPPKRTEITPRATRASPPTSPRSPRGLATSSQTRTAAPPTPSPVITIRTTRERRTATLRTTTATTTRTFPSPPKLEITPLRGKFSPPGYHFRLLIPRCDSYSEPRYDADAYSLPSQVTSNGVRRALTRKETSAEVSSPPFVLITPLMLRSYRPGDNVSESILDERSPRKYNSPKVFPSLSPRKNDAHSFLRAQETSSPSTPSLPPFATPTNPAEFVRCFLSYFRIEAQFLSRSWRTDRILPHPIHCCLL